MRCLMKPRLHWFSAIQLPRRWRMTTARRRSASLLLAGAVAGLVLAAFSAHAINIDPRGEVRLGLRSYVAARIGTQTIGSENNPLNWPRSGAGHLRQNRFFVQLSYDHDLTRMVKESWGL